MQARPFVTRPNDDVIVTSFVIRRGRAIGCDTDDWRQVIHTTRVVHEQLGIWMKVS